MTRHLAILFIAFFLLHSLGATARKLHDRHNKYKIWVPDRMRRMQDTVTNDGDLYYDSSAGVVLIISSRKSQFHSVKDYMDCTREELEDQLRIYYSDSTLKLISCNRSLIYPNETAEVVFHVSVLPYGFDNCFVYFIHYKRRDLQFSFAYKDGTQPYAYIYNIMQTLKLR